MEQLETIILTGLSGAGKTTALRALEDLGFYCVDNLPLPLLDSFIETMKRESTIDRAALVVDARLGQHLQGYADAYVALTKRGDVLEVVYLDSSDAALLRRFSQTRRRHPLSGDDLRAGLRQERELLAPLRTHASLCIDTSEMNVHQLKRMVQERYEQQEERLAVSVMSFGFSFGIPSQADLVFDARFLPNPFFVEELRPLTGLDPRVAGYVLAQPDAAELVERIAKLAQFLLPRYEAEGKAYLTLCIGCTGGRHRSVALAQEIGRRLEGVWPVRLQHRDVARQ